MRPLRRTNQPPAPRGSQYSSMLAWEPPGGNRPAGLEALILAALLAISCLAPSRTVGSSSIVPVALDRRQGRCSLAPEATWPILARWRSSRACMPCHGEWQAGQAETAAAGGTDRRPAKNAAAPLPRGRPAPLAVHGAAGYSAGPLTSSAGPCGVGECTQALTAGPAV